MRYHYKFRNANSAVWHDIYIEANSVYEAQTEVIKQLGTDFELKLVDDDSYTEEELLQIDCLT